MFDAELFLELSESKNMAEIIAKALRVDDPEWCESISEGEKLKVRIETKKVESLISACEDYFRTLRVALEVICLDKHLNYRGQLNEDLL